MDEAKVQEMFVAGIDGSDCARRAAEFAAQRALATYWEQLKSGEIQNRRKLTKASD